MWSQCYFSYHAGIFFGKFWQCIARLSVQVLRQFMAVVFQDSLMKVVWQCIVRICGPWRIVLAVCGLASFHLSLGHRHVCTCLHLYVWWQPWQWSWNHKQYFFFFSLYFSHWFNCLFYQQQKKNLSCFYKAKKNRKET